MSKASFNNEKKNLPRMKNFMCTLPLMRAFIRAAERGGRGANCPGSPGSGAPRTFLLGPSHFFGSNIFAQRARYLFFLGKIPKFVMKN
jgi:hypothetical protein